MLKLDGIFKFNKNDRIVVGCSTGPDSMALVDMLLKIRHYLFSIYYLALVFVLCFCKKDSQYTKGLETNADGVEAYVEALNENIKNLQQLVQLYPNGQSLITRVDYDKKEDSYRFTFTSGEVLRFYFSYHILNK